MYKKRVSNESPPALLKATTIVAGISGYIRVGYLPELSEDGHVTLIALENTSMVFDIEEIANFFMFIRRHDDFSDLDDAESYFNHISDEFMGNSLYVRMVLRTSSLLLTAL